MNYWADVLYESPDTNLAAYESAAGTIEGVEPPPELNHLDHKDDERIRGLARKLDVEPEDAIRATNQKFVRRFRFIEAALKAEGRTPDQSTLDEMDALWGAAKAQEKPA